MSNLRVAHPAQEHMESSEPRGPWAQDPEDQEDPGSKGLGSTIQGPRGNGYLVGFLGVLGESFF